MVVVMTMARAMAALALRLPGLLVVVVAKAMATVGKAADTVLLLQVHQVGLLHGINKAPLLLQVVNPATAATAVIPVRAMAMPMQHILLSQLWVLLLDSVVLLVDLVLRLGWVLFSRTTTLQEVLHLLHLPVMLLHLL